MRYRLVIFDCDGTLVDTATDVAQCFADALEECGFPRCSYEEVAALLGKPLPEIVSGLLPIGVIREDVEKVSSAYRALYSTCPKENTVLFSGMGELVDSLIDSGIAVAVNSNKPEPALIELIGALLPDRDIAMAGFLDGREPKPSPEACLQLAKQAGCEPGESLYVGDTIIDVETANAAGMSCAIVEWGQGVGLNDDERVVCYARSAAELRSFLEEGARS